MLITLQPEYQFKVSTTTEGLERGISGVLHCRQGKFLLDLTIVDSGVSDTIKGLKLELDKPTAGGGYGSGLSYLRVIRIQRHKSRVASLPELTALSLPNKPMLTTPR
jgi:hypothetical protein